MLTLVMFEKWQVHNLTQPQVMVLVGYYCHWLDCGGDVRPLDNVALNPEGVS